VSAPANGRPTDRPHGASLRLRLTLSYAVVFFIVALLLLTISYGFVHAFLIRHPDELLNRTAQHFGLSQTFLQKGMPAGGNGTGQTVGAFMRTTQDAVVRAITRGTVIVTFWALAIAAAVSVGLGWLVAGRMLRPLQEIIGVARRLSASTLHERIGLHGPKDELRELADTFDAMLARLSQAFDAQREFVANASHELRTPLAIIRTELDVTLADPATDAAELRRMAETIRVAISRSEGIVDKLLVLAESEEMAEREPLDLGALVGGAVERSRRAAQARHVAFDVRLQPATVSGDAPLLEHLVDNLLDNAVRYSPEGGVVAVEVRGDSANGGAGALRGDAAPGGDVTLQVSNGGEVIDPQELPRLFERFYRRGTSRSRATGGSGLGLAIVAAVADVHGGRVEAQAPASGGLIMTVTLPQTATPAAAR
jgi:signal transduction histidine kinase